MKKNNLCIVFLFFISCKDVFKSSISEKVSGKWEINNVIVNDIESKEKIDTLNILLYSFSYPEKGPAEINIYLNIGDTIGYYHSEWSVLNDKHLLISDAKYSHWCDSNWFPPYKPSIVPGLIDCDETWEIVSINRKEFHLKMEYNGNTFETNFKKMK